MSIFRAMQINTSGLNLDRLKLDTISTNITNINTTRTAEGGPYKRKVVVFTENLENEKNRLRLLSTENASNNRSIINKVNILNEKSILNKGNGSNSEGVKVVGIGEDNSESRIEYDPSHPDADENGYVEMPNVNMVDEMIDLIKTLRSYEANVTALNTSKSILKKALEITKG